MKLAVDSKDLWKLLNPCPTVLITARHEDRNQVCAVAWCMPLDFDPPKAVLVLASGQATTEAARASGELVINVPGAGMAEKVLAAGRTSGRKRDKFRDFDLRTCPSKHVKAPSLLECLANIDCRILEQGTPVGEALRESYDVVLVEMLGGCADERYFQGRWLIENGARLLHHLGEDGFAVSETCLKAGAIF
ncbi:MAG: flavin reductase family protein [Candidatus Hydrogenedentota bacterium]